MQQKIFRLPQKQNPNSFALFQWKSGRVSSQNTESTTSITGLPSTSHKIPTRNRKSFKPMLLRRHANRDASYTNCHQHIFSTTTTTFPETIKATPLYPDMRGHGPAETIQRARPFLVTSWLRIIRPNVPGVGFGPRERERDGKRRWI